MKFTNETNHINIVNDGISTLTVVKNIIENEHVNNAFYVFDIGTIVKNFNLWKEKFSRIQPFYALKSNNTGIFVKTLASLGVNFDCASENEMKQVLSLGVNPDRIILANASKHQSHINYAANFGVKMMTFDNELELHKVKELYPNAHLLIRIRYGGSLKFGCDPVREAPRFLEIAKQLGLTVIGVSFHLGCPDPMEYRYAMEAARYVFDIGLKLGFNLKLLNIGGGFPGYKGSPIDKYADAVNRALEDFFPDPSIRVMAEPGRYFNSSPFTLVSYIHSIHPLEATKENVKQIMYYIDDGVHTSFSLVKIEGKIVKPIPLSMNKDVTGELLLSTVWGSTCSGRDCVINDVLLPELGLGDRLVFEDMGCYSLALATSFNGMPIPKIYTVAEKSVWNGVADLMKNVSFTDVE